MRQSRRHLHEHVQPKKAWGTLNGAWVPHDTGDQVVDYINHWANGTELPVRRLLGWLGLGTSKFRDWKHRYGKVNEHNGKVPRDSWLEDWDYATARPRASSPGCEDQAGPPGVAERLVVPSKVVSVRFSTE